MTSSRLWLFLCVLLSLATYQAPASASGVQLKVLSFNVRYGLADDGADSWPHRSGMVIGRVKAYDPDIIGLQEALDFQIDAILSALPQYKAIGLARDGGNKGEFSAVLYRWDRLSPEENGTFWLSDTPEKPSISWGNQFRRIVTWARFMDGSTGRPFLMYNTHFDHASAPSRMKSAELLAATIAHYREPLPVILSGDFNDTPGSAPILHIRTAAGLTDTFGSLHPSEAQSGTFHGFTGKRTDNRIDYIFVSGDVEIETAEIDHSNMAGRYPSDHFPIVATVVLPARE